jgi:formamidopyrimidine-DNA glycosylase
VPELPEVETARRHIELALVGKRIEQIENRLPKLLRDSPFPDLSILEGRTLASASRRAKVLILGFGDLSLLMHFKLAGQWAIMLPDGTRLVAGHPVPDPSGLYPHKSTHVTFRFDDGAVAYYSDVRQFGWLRLIPSDEVDVAIEFFKFGPEGTGPLDMMALGRVFSRRGIPVKTLLLDQTFIAGLGNIYVDEALFRARIHPSRAANSLSPVQRKALLTEIPPVLAEGILQGGARIIHNKAHPVNEFPAVHGRSGEPCFVCGTAVQKIRVGGRGTYFCPSCQKLPRTRKVPSSKVSTVA